MSVLQECDSCQEMKPIDGGEEVVVHTHRVEGMAVAQDTEWVCADCVIDAEESRVERQLESRYWRGYDRWEEQQRRL